METYVVRAWLPDRPGALGAVASRIGAVGADVIGIEILETGGGRAIDELVVQLPDAGLVDLLVSEVSQVDGVDVEDVRPVSDAVHDPRLDALETAAILVGASTVDELTASLAEHARRGVGAAWAVVLDVAGGSTVASDGPAPLARWLTAYVDGARSSANERQPGDIAWAPLPAARLAVVLGRDGQTFRARERRQLAALARIVDTRFRELKHVDSRRSHPSTVRP
ncbi:hypothetical protein BH24ACT3_BH24ACT3_03360 [soil metagenome]